MNNNEMVLLESLLDFDEKLSGHVRNGELPVSLGAGNNHPMRVLQARSIYGEAFFSAIATTTPGKNAKGQFNIHDALLDVLVAVANLVREFSVTKGKVRAGRGDKASLPKRPNAPLPPCLKRNWAQMNPSGYQHEFPLARAISGVSAAGKFERGLTEVAIGPLCTNLLPLIQRGKSWQWNDKSRSAVWALGASLSENLAAILRRRLIDAGKGDGDGLPLWSSEGAGFSDLLAFWNRQVDEDRLSDLIHALALVDTENWTAENIDHAQENRDPTPDLHPSAVWFGDDGAARIRTEPLAWNDRELLSRPELDSAFALPRVYALLKLCFLGGRLPARPVGKCIVRRTGKEPYPPHAPEILNLLQAGRLAEAVEIAARKLRAKGYPPIFDPASGNALELNMTHDDCQRLAGMLLIPVRHAGVLAALAIKPRSTNH